MKKPHQILLSGGAKFLFGVNLGVNTQTKNLNSNFINEKEANIQENPPYSKRIRRVPMAEKEGFE